MSFEPRDYLRHTLVEAEYLLDQSQPLDYERFAADETLRRAFVRAWKFRRSSEEPARGVPGIAFRG